MAGTCTRLLQSSELSVEREVARLVPSGCDDLNPGPRRGFCAWLILCELLPLFPTANKSPQTWGLKAKATFILCPHSFGDQKPEKMLKSLHCLPLTAGGSMFSAG